jgi:hypothetical protein
MRVLGDEQCFGFAVTALLADVSNDVLASVVPDKGCGCKANAQTGVEKSPAKIDIITCCAKLGIKATDGVKSPCGDSEVAAWNVLGTLVIELDDQVGSAGEDFEFGWLLGFHDFF